MVDVEIRIDGVNGDQLIPEHGTVRRCGDRDPAVPGPGNHYVERSSARSCPVMYVCRPLCVETPLIRASFARPDGKRFGTWGSTAVPISVI